jgi:acylpyruvate hydrolase
MVPADMLELLQGEEDSIVAAKEALAFAEHSIQTADAREKLRRAGILFSHDEIQLEAPLPNPPHLLSLGLNYRKHALETGNELPKYPIIFTKEGRMIGPGATIKIPAVVQEPDYEAELAFVIGKRAFQVSEDKALEYVVGYASFNDVSARALQGRVSQWTLGKSVDTFSVMGPYLVLKDEIPDPHDLRISTRIGDEILQDSNTRDMIFNVAQVIAYVSQVIALEPGTVITTGTPSGVGAARQPPRFLQHGETVTVEIEKLGTLSNPVARE